MRECADAIQISAFEAAFSRGHHRLGPCPPTTGESRIDGQPKFYPMKKRSASRGSKKNELVPTGALHPFYDPLQLETRKPRQDSFEVLFKGALQQHLSDGTIKIICGWADVTTKELQKWTDLFTAELLRRAFAGEDDAITSFAHKVGGLVSRLEDLTKRQRGKIEEAAVISPFWSVNITQRNTDFNWAKKHVRELNVGSKSLLPQNALSMIRRHGNPGRLAEKLWLQLLKNRHELPTLIKAARGSEHAHELKTKWISRLLALPTVPKTAQALRTAQDVSLNDALGWWECGKALLLEAWHVDRQAAFGSVLPKYEGRKSSRKTLTKLSDAEMRKDIIDKQFRKAFLSLLGHSRS